MGKEFVDMATWRNQITVWNRAMIESQHILETFRDRYYGKRCFIIGNGPSLNHIDWSLFKNEYTFGLNRIYLLFEKMRFVPSFYLCINPFLIEQFIEEIYQIPSPKFLPSNYIRFVKNPEGIAFFKSTTTRLFSMNITDEVSEGSTVTYSAMQLAYYMGFSEVILIGVDHYYRFEGAPNTAVVSQGDDPNHFHPNYFGKGMRWQLPDLQNSEISYQLAKSVFEADGRIILDGTINGRLTVFPKVDYRDILESRKKNSLPISEFLPLSPNLSSFYGIRKQTTISTKNYKVSAIISTYNAENYIAGCLQDLENQSIASAIEIIVIDSGSQQNEEAVVREFQLKYDNIQYIRTEQRETIYQAWNRGILVANGQYITNANTDDRHTQDAIEKMAIALDTHPDCVLVYANQQYFEDVDGERKFLFTRKRGEYSIRRLYEECFVGSQPMWRKRIHKEVGMFDEMFFSAGDYEFWLRIGQKYPFVYLDEFLGERLIRYDSLEYEGGSLTSYYESATILKCYKYANLNSLIVDEHGLSNHPIFSGWCEINVLKKKTITRLTEKEPEVISFVKDWRESRQEPVVSIIITTYNREKDLLSNLYELNLQNEKNFEVILVNNGTKLEAFDKKPVRISYNLCYLQLRENNGPSLGRNVGAKYARSDLIAILDDDARADPDWVKNIKHHFYDEKIVALRGRVLPKSQNAYAHIPPNYDLGDEPYFNSTGLEMNSAYRLRDFLEQGGFDEHLWFYEGAELSYRIWKSNNNRLGCIMYYPDVVIHHDYSTNPNHLIESQIRMKENRRVIELKWPGFDKFSKFHWDMLPQNRKEKDFNWLLKAMLFCYADNPLVAIEYAWQAVHLSYLDIRPFLILGAAYFRLGKIDDSIAAFETVLILLESKVSSEELAKSNQAELVKNSYIQASLKLTYLYLKIGASDKAQKTLDHLKTNQLLFPLNAEAELRMNQILKLAAR